MFKKSARWSSLFVFYLLVIFLVMPVFSSQAASLDERDALIAFYDSTGGENWNSDSGWLGEEGTECTWEGITCDNDGNVTEITLWDNNIVGPLPPEFADLASLVLLDVFLNDINALGGDLRRTVWFGRRFGLIKRGS